MIFDVRTQASDKDTDMRGGLQMSAKPIAFIIFTFDGLKWYRERYFTLFIQRAYGNKERSRRLN